MVCSQVWFPVGLNCSSLSVATTPLNQEDGSFSLGLCHVWVDGIRVRPVCVRSIGVLSKLVSWNCMGFDLCLFGIRLVLT